MLVSVVSPKKICLFLQLSLTPDALLVPECWLDLAPNVINGGCTPLGKRWRAPSSRVNVRAVPIDRWIDNYMERYRRASVHRCQSALLSIECHLAVQSATVTQKVTTTLLCSRSAPHDAQLRDQLEYTGPLLAHA